MLVGPKFGFKLKLSFASSSRFNHLASQFENVQNCLTRPCGGADKDIFGGSDFILKLDTHQPLHSHYQNIIFWGAGGKHRVHFLVDLVTISRFDNSNKIYFLPLWTHSPIFIIRLPFFTLGTVGTAYVHADRWCWRFVRSPLQVLNVKLPEAIIPRSTRTRRR